ncbi:MAG: hypothetical protein AABP62_14140 [Planctomycetota bacterium]
MSCSLTSVEKQVARIQIEGKLEGSELSALSEVIRSAPDPAIRRQSAKREICGACHQVLLV